MKRAGEKEWTGRQRHTEHEKKSTEGWLTREMGESHARSGGFN